MEAQAGMFLVFVLVSMVWHKLEDWLHVYLEKHKHHTEEAALLRRKRSLLAGCCGAITAPGIFDGIRDFLIHIVFYSGYIIPIH